MCRRASFPSMDRRSMQLQVNNYPKRFLRSVSLTWADAPPPGTKIAQGIVVVGFFRRRVWQLSIALHSGCICMWDRRSIFEWTIRRFQHARCRDIQNRRRACICAERICYSTGLLRPAGDLVWSGACDGAAPIARFRAGAFCRIPDGDGDQHRRYNDTIQGVMDQITIVIRFWQDFRCSPGW